MAGMPHPEPQTIATRIRTLLAAAPGPLTTRHIAEQVHTTPPQAARRLRDLEDAGLVRRELAPGGAYQWSATP